MATQVFRYKGISWTPAVRRVSSEFPLQSVTSHITFSYDVIGQSGRSIPVETLEQL